MEKTAKKYAQQNDRINCSPYEDENQKTKEQIANLNLTIHFNLTIHSS